MLGFMDKAYPAGLKKYQADLQSESDKPHHHATFGTKWRSRLPLRKILFTVRRFQQTPTTLREVPEAAVKCLEQGKGSMDHEKKAPHRPSPSE